MKQRLLVASAALINQSNHILLAQRPSDKSYPGMWEFPGGKLEQGEMPDQALIRELEEELGIQVQADHLSPLNFTTYAYPEFDMVLFLYAARKWQGEITPREGQTLSWLDMAALRDIALLPADKPLLEPIEHYIQTAL